MVKPISVPGLRLSPLLDFSGNVPYTHPGVPEHVMRVYRAFCLGEKKSGRGRAHIKYLSYVGEYLAAKRVVLIDNDWYIKKLRAKRHSVLQRKSENIL